MIFKGKPFSWAMSAESELLGVISIVPPSKAGSDAPPFARYWIDRHTALIEKAADARVLAEGGRVGNDERDADRR